MSATYNDVMSKIADISTNLQSCFTALQAKGVTVPADSSLDDLATLIAAIPDSSHPDYDLPWLMADGSHGFISHARTNLSSNNTGAVTVELMPASDSNSYIFGTSNSYNGLTGMNQMTAGLRARFRLCSVDSSGNVTVNENNYAGLNSQFTDSSYPYNKKLTDLYQSINSTSEYRVVVYNGITTVTASASLAQPSSSAWPNYAVGILCRTQMAGESGSNSYLKVTTPAVAGTKLYELKMYSGAWSNKTLNATYKPVLHWDSQYEKYRPCFKNTDGTLTTFAIADGNNTVDSSVDGAYYIDTTLGLTETKVTDITSSKNIDTIPYDATGATTYIANLRVGGTTTARTTLTTGGNDPTSISAYLTSTGSGQDYYFYVRFQGSNSNRKNSLMGTVTGSTFRAASLIMSWTPSSSYSVSRWSSADDTIAAKTNITGLTAANGNGNAISLRNSNNNNNKSGVNSLMAVDSSTGKILNYLVLCTYNGNLVYYDCVNKTIYS